MLLSLQSLTCNGTDLLASWFRISLTSPVSGPKLQPLIMTDASGSTENCLLTDFKWGLLVNVWNSEVFPAMSGWSQKMKLVMNCCASPRCGALGFAILCNL